MHKNNALINARLIGKMAKHAGLNLKAGNTEKQSSDKNDSSSRFDGSGSVARIYKKDTPGEK
jgi:hypothetical protein